MTPTDALARFHRMPWRERLPASAPTRSELPAENAAIKQKVNPRDWTLKNIDNMRRQVRTMGGTFDWNSEVVTCDP